MGISRLFWPQEVLDQWIVDEKISMEGDILTVAAEGRTYKTAQAVLFSSDVGDGEDTFRLVGRVKALSVLEEMGAECYMDSVILQDSAYEVVGGFLGELCDVEDLSRTRPRVPSSSGRAAASGQDVSPGQVDGDESDDKELLAKFLIENL